MATRDTAWPEGTPCWVDLAVDDLPRARAFYSSLFGWDIPEGAPEFGGYTMGALDGRQVAGIGPKMGDGMPTVWTTYLASDDADATASKITAAGGQLISEPFDVGEAGRMAVAADPSGAVFGLWQGRQHTGAQLVNAPGALLWNENMSRDFTGNEAFYRAVFGYSYGDVGGGDFRYATLDLNGRSVGGIGELGADQPAEVPAHWSAYFGVADTDATVATAVRLGGELIAPAFDSPYGRIAVLSDDQGAVFSVMTAGPDD
jgi:predicted enzyme related to lactoylglutathione lyase